MTIFPEYDPEFEVWNHLESGLQSARDELRPLEKQVRTALEHLAKAVADTRGVLILPPSKASLLVAESQLLSHPWIKHAIDTEIASEGISRANEALDRYQSLKPATAANALPEPVVRYIKEAAATYLFGFDAACIAFCRAALEQLLKDSLVKKRIYTQPQLRRERPTAGTLLEKAKQAGIIGSGYTAAKRVVERGDQVLHRAIHDGRILKTTAADSVNDLVSVVVAILA